MREDGTLESGLLGSEMWRRFRSREEGELCFLQSHLLRMIGLAGSHGPWISFLYFCSPRSHQLQMPIARRIKILPATLPTIAAVHLPPLIVTPTPLPAPMTSKIVIMTCARNDTCRRCRRNTGNKPKTSIENNVSEKTCLVEVRRDARTVDAMRAALVEREAGNLQDDRISSKSKTC